jgi:putative nucleotidyltransferase with HDIG domain
MKYPSEIEAKKLLVFYKIPKEIVQHSNNVMKNASEIANQIISKGNKVDYKLVRSGALLHDIGRWLYNYENGYPDEMDYHEFETERLLSELGYPEFGDMLKRHILGGITKYQAEQIGYPDPSDTISNCTEIKIIMIADNIRPEEGIMNLEDIINKYRTSEKLAKRYFNKCPGLRDLTIKRVKKVWKELVDLGMKNPPT